MRRFKTSYLFAMTIAAFVLVGVTRKGIVALRIVKDTSGSPVFRRDGKILTEYDLWGDIKVNWFSNVCLVLFVVFFFWWLIRLLRASKIGHRG